MGNAKPTDRQRLQNNTPGARAERGLRRWLTDGSLAPGERLPTEQALADHLEVSRTTIRKALAQLAEAGQIYQPHKQRGWIVANPKGPAIPLPATHNLAMIAPTSLPLRCLREYHPAWDEQVFRLVHQRLFDYGYHVTHLHPDSCTGTGVLNPQGFCALLVIKKNSASPAVEAVIQTFLTADTPVIKLGDYRQDPAPIHLIKPDLQRAAADITRWLLSQGQRRILPCWTIHENQLPPPSLDQRDKGYQTAMEEAGLDPMASLVVHLPLPSHDSRTDRGSAARLTAAKLKDRIRSAVGLDAVIALSDTAAEIIGQALTDLFGHKQKKVAVASLSSNFRCPGSNPELFPTVSMELKIQDIADQLVDLVRSPPLKPVQQLIKPALSFSLTNQTRP